MRLWKVVVLLNLTLALGVGLGVLMAAREVRELRHEIGRLQAAASRPGASSWTVRGIVRSVIPKLGAVFITHEAIPGLMEQSMTMGFEAEDGKMLEGLAPGDPVRFTVRQEANRILLLAIEKVPGP